MLIPLLLFPTLSFLPSLTIAILYTMSSPLPLSVGFNTFEMPLLELLFHLSNTTTPYHYSSKITLVTYSQRITYKIASVTFKTLHFYQPSHLYVLLTAYNPTRFFRS